MTIYDVLCYSKDECHLAHKFVNVGSLSTVQTGNLSSNNGFFQNTADSFNGKIPELHNACLTLSGKELKKGDDCTESYSAEQARAMLGIAE